MTLPPSHLPCPRPTDTHGSEEPKGYPAWSEADRAEHQAEKAFEQLVRGRRCCVHPAVCVHAVR